MSVKNTLLYLKQIIYNRFFEMSSIAYYSNSMATQALLLSGDVEKNPGPCQGKAASTNNQLSRSKPTAEKCDHCQKTVRWN